MIAGMFAEALAESLAEKGPEILPEAAIERLRDAGARYGAMLDGPRFSKGDLVTPFADASVTGAGKPFLVVETRANAGLIFAEGGATRPDMRVLHINRHGDVCAHWVESFEFESYPSRSAATARTGE